MRLILTVALGLAAAGAAHAQIQPIRPPANPYALPQPAMSSAPRPPQVSTIRPIEPANEGFKPFTPYKPATHVDTNTAPSGLYPELHRKPKKHDGF